MTSAEPFWGEGDAGRPRDIFSAAERCLTGREAHRFAEEAYRLAPHLRGLRPADLLAQVASYRRYAEVAELVELEMAAVPVLPGAIAAATGFSMLHDTGPVTSWRIAELAVRFSREALRES